MRTTKAAALARPAQQQIQFHFLNFDLDAKRVYVDASTRILRVLEGMGLRHQWVRRRRTEGFRALVDVAEDMTTLWNAGATEAELRQFPNALNELIDRLSTGCAVRPLPTIDQLEQHLEGQETSMQTERLVLEAQGTAVPVAHLLREADITEAEANVGLEKSRALRRRARLQGATMSCFLAPIAVDGSVGASSAQVSILLLVLIPAVWGVGMALALEFARHRRR